MQGDIMKKTISRYMMPVMAAIVFMAAVVWLLAALNSADRATRSEQLEAVSKSIEDDITLCYAIEGSYPENLGYLSENYGLNYDKTKYVVHYECFASNIRPSVTVIEKES